MNRKKKGEGFTMGGHHHPGPNQKPGPPSKFWKGVKKYGGAALEHVARVHFGAGKDSEGNPVAASENLKSGKSDFSYNLPSLKDIFRRKKSKNAETKVEETKNEVVNKVDKEGKEKYGYLPWEEGYTKENEVKYDESGKPIERNPIGAEDLPGADPNLA